MLVLFDIDGTLVASRGVGRRAMESAGRELFGPAFTCDGIPFAGSLDPLIWIDLCARNGIPDGGAQEGRFRSAYARHLERGIAAGGAPVPLPGVIDLLDLLARRSDVALGLLTGNYPETGRRKIEAAGIASARFVVGAFGPDGARRQDLVPAALARFERSAGRTLPGDRVVIVGDTPADVECARAHGCRSLAVATGSFARGVLEAAGATRVEDDLRRTEDLAAWLADA